MGGIVHAVIKTRGNFLHVMFSSPHPLSPTQISTSAFFLGLTKFLKDIIYKEERNFSGGIGETCSSFAWKVVTENIMNVADFTKETSI